MTNFVDNSIDKFLSHIKESSMKRGRKGRGRKERGGGATTIVVRW